MNKKWIRILLVIGLIVAVQLIVGRIVKARLQPVLEDPRWQAAVNDYKDAKRHHAPEAEMESKKKAIGEVFTELQKEKSQQTTEQPETI